MVFSKKKKKKTKAVSEVIGALQWETSKRKIQSNTKAKISTDPLTQTQTCVVVA